MSDDSITSTGEIIECHRVSALIPHNLFISARGGSSAEKGIKSIHLGVSTLGPCSIEDARKLLLFLTDDLLSRYNSSDQIRPYLLEYPMKIKDIEYVLCFINPDSNFWVQDQQTSEPQIAHVSVYNGRFFYCINLSDKMIPLKEIHTETYEEAKKILLQEKQQG